MLGNDSERSARKWQETFWSSPRILNTDNLHAEAPTGPGTAVAFPCFGCVESRFGACARKSPKNNPTWLVAKSRKAQEPNQEKRWKRSGGEGETKESRWGKTEKLACKGVEAVLTGAPSHSGSRAVRAPGRCSTAAHRWRHLCEKHASSPEAPVTRSRGRGKLARWSFSLSSGQRAMAVFSTRPGDGASVGR